MLIILIDWPSLHLPDRIPEVLAGNPNGGPRHADDHGHLVVELEGPVVYVDLIKLEVADQITEQVCHGAGVISLLTMCYYWLHLVLSRDQEWVDTQG